MLVTDKWADIEIDKKQVCHYMGYEADYKLSARISSLVDEYIENAYHLIDPFYSYVIRDIELVQGSVIIIEGSIIFESKVIARLLKQCHKVAVFLATIGKYLEETSYQLAKDGLVLQSTVLDAIGTDAVEKVAALAQERIAEVAAAQELVISQRFSPGYCDWDLEQQKMIFKAVDGDLVGIHLTDGCLMIPQKSISGIIGIGHSGSNVENYNPCKVCRKLDCLGRR